MNCGLCHECVFYEPNQTEVEQRVDEKYLCLHPEVGGRFRVDFGCVLHTGADSVEVNVPNHIRKPTMNAPNPNPVDGPVEILIVTFGTPTMRVSGKIVSDLDWLRWSLRSIRKHCSGFQGVTVVHPRHESELFEPLRSQFDIRLHAFDEPKGKGFMAHMVQMANADSIVPPSTKYVLHCDSDCIFKMPTTPEHYFWEDKPYYIVRSWESLTTEDPRNPGSKVVSDCAQWREPTNFQLGFSSPIYAMCMNTVVMPVKFYKRYRTHVERVHRKPFSDFMLEGRNEHPATRMDHTAMGSYAYAALTDDFTWFHVDNGIYPEDRKRAFWSHSGIDANTERELEELCR